ncbi:Non-classical phosphatidylinositol transfer protein (PITP) [Onygenales sp. PD_40]|nr:Non-classical phosphatidylinositol transfer protein (PITP) [Onygenales sp. PD_40]KAK2770004.1 Non-classical phosphatidylinositol transfer protein (PITP) [Emmonsiellopsis sp. PD_33]KAK2794758.1 Non-classical phosphatidylinositol transfer protein (PITP) [Onygenales sp. PD_12]KAK2807104.1 Non-classical phosphatidylinositol transfer protein (PITP) [Onygenales sp. PD_10]
MSEVEKPSQPAPAAEAAVPEKAPEQPANGAAPAAEATEKPAEKPAETPAADAPAAAPAPAKAADVDAIEEQKQESAAAPKKDESETKAPEAPADTRPEYLKNNPALAQFFEHLAGILEKTGHSEMWGVTLKNSEHIPTVNVLIKFLRANEGNLKLAEEQLTKALEWRKKMDPLGLAEKSTFSSKKFKGLGYVANYKDAKDGDVVFTWNIYGAVKDIDSTFGDVDEFIKWRVALMEMAVRDLKLSEATTVIDYAGEDPYQMIQVHDYLNVSFLRLNPSIRSATKQTIEVFSTAYPELLKEKFFVNVPAVMGWVFTALKVFLSKNTIRKFHPISNGANLAREFSFADALPKTYGGKAAELEESARTVSLKEDTPAPTPPAEPAETAAAPAPEASAEPANQATETPKEAPKEAETPKPTETPAEAAAPAAEPEKPAAPAATEAPAAK